MRSSDTGPAATAAADLPLPRELKIGRATVGLIGLDRALAAVLADRSRDREAAVETLFAAIARENYIPAGMADAYRQALAREYDRLQAGRPQENHGLTIRILGPGCVACNSLQQRVLETVSQLGVAADVLQVHDPDEIGRFGVLLTPALVINGRLKSQGRHPTPAQIEAWLREAAGL